MADQIWQDAGAAGQIQPKEANKTIVKQTSGNVGASNDRWGNLFGAGIDVVAAKNVQIVGDNTAKQDNHVRPERRDLRGFGANRRRLAGSA